MGAAAEAAYVTAPMTGGIYRIPIDDGADRFVIPVALAGQPCNWTAQGSDADIVFGGSGVTAVYDQQASVDGSGNITPHASSGMRLYNGAKAYWVMPPVTAATTHFSVVCKGSGLGTLEIVKAGGGTP